MASDFASESGHWYFRDGRTCYTLIGKNGIERNTTLRDARKLGLYPSVTMISKLMAAPQLVDWQIEQAVRAATLFPKRDPDFEPEQAYVDRIIKTTRDKGFAVADRGSEIHTGIERLLKGLDCKEEIRPFAQAVVDLLNKHYPGVPWEQEKSFASPYGYGGKCDLHSKIGIVVDYKSKKEGIDKVKCYDNHFMQNAAYAHGLGMPEAQCANIFVSQYLPAKAVILQHDQMEMVRGWKMFSALLDLYYAKTGLER